jgi:hypothetical protein
MEFGVVFSSAEGFRGTAGIPSKIAIFSVYSERIKKSANKLA